MSDKRTHTSDCDWHVDQYPWECTCGFIPRKKAMDNLIAQDADLIVLDDPGFNKPANTLVRDMSRAIHKVLSKDNIDAYLMMSRDVAGDAARSVLPFIKADRIEALEAENERLSYNGIHTCSDACQRLPCVQRREIERLREVLGFAMRTLEAEGFSSDGPTITSIRAALTGDSHDK